ncbi:MAG: HlyD family efflux transporter periplasmic adaptor subunit [Nannocystaceae bacterium]|nr:HlyD family efflux transporter periplasmic adaptor subunit [bacterium]
MLIVAVLVAVSAVLLAAAAWVSSPEYVSGRALIRFDGVTFARASSGGAIDAIFVQPGQWVETGELLARTEATAAKHEHSTARAEYDDAVRAMLRAPANLTARERVGERVHALARARAALDATEIRAPSAGRVQAVRVRAGQTTEAGQVVCTVAAEAQSARIVAFLPGNARPKLDVDAPLRLTLDRHPDAQVRLRVDHISDSSLSPGEVEALADARITGDEHGSIALGATTDTVVRDDRGRSLQLFDGMTATVEVLVRERSLLERLLREETR